MKITFLCVGKTDPAYLRDGIAVYASRLRHYAPFDVRTAPDIKNPSPARQKDLEGQHIIAAASDSELWLLCERGRAFSSVEFASFLQKRLLGGARGIVFAAGGAYGFADAVYERAQGCVSLSAMTFSHQMVRLFFVEQLYRAFTIMHGEPYHHQ